MQFRDVTNSLTFRYIAKYVLVLSSTVFLLLGSFYLYFSYSSVRDLGRDVLAELQTLQQVYQEKALPGVEAYLDAQAARPAVKRFYYLLSDEEGRKIAGNIGAQPSYREFDEGWLGFEMALPAWGRATDVDFLARAAPLDSQYSVMVATDYADIQDRARLVFRTLFRVMIATIILGVTGGFFSAARALDRVEQLNREVARVIRAGPGQRLQMPDERGYIKALASAMNQMLEQMESLMQGVRRVSDNIAHDLRTPLTRMRNNLSQLSNKLEGAEAHQLTGIIEECDDLLASFNALLRISALESGNRLAGGAEVDLRSLLNDVVELYEPLAQERRISLVFDAPEPGACLGDSDLLFQLFANLLDNALKYTPDEGEIAVRLRKVHADSGDALPPPGYLVVVADSGPGIPVTERKNVFRRFYRVEASRTEQPGNGLGLSLVQAIVHYHHGEIELGSNNPGLQVRIRLP